MSVQLRRLERTDLPDVVFLEEALFGEDAWSMGMLQSELNGLPDRYFLAAHDDGEMVGYAGLLAPGGGQADVLTLAVAQPRWGEGIGARLLEALLTEAERRGCAEVYLEVRVDNDRAQRLYRRHGFTAAGLRRGYYQPSGADALVMRRVIGSAGHPARSGPPDGAAAGNGPRGGDRTGGAK